MTVCAYAVQPLPELTPDMVLQHYEELTFPPIARRLAVRSPRGPWRGAVALAADGPAGLAIVELPPGDSAQIVSLAVVPAHRRRGLGAALLAELERLAAAGGAPAIEGAYRTSWRTRRAIEALLAARAWSLPQTRLLLARGDVASAAAVLRSLAPQLPAEAELFTWSDLAAEERRAIFDRQAEDPWYPQILDPFQEEPRLAETVSVGLRWRGEVAGWLVAHRLAFDTVQYSALFLRPDLRGAGLARALVREAARRRLADPDLRFAIFSVDARNTRMRQLADGPLAPYRTAASELRVSRKRLEP